MAILNHGSTIRTADGGQSTATIVTASNIGTYGVAANSTYYVGTTQNVFNRASGAQTLTGVSIDGNAANITAYTINQNVGSGNTPSFAGMNSTAMLVSYTSLTNGDDWSNSPISIRERGLVSAAQSINAYSPNLNFHWGSRISNSLWMDANGNLAWGSYSETGVPSSDGAFYAANLYASIYFDKNDTTYYLDPANTGTSLLVAGKVGIGATAPDTNLQVVGHVHVGNQTTFENVGGWNKTIYLDGLVHSRLRILGSAYASGKNSSTETYLWVDNSVAPYSGLATNAGSFQISAGFTTILNSARSPLFYDSDNTAYYIDAASTSNLVGLTVANTITGSISGNAATATNVAWSGITSKPTTLSGFGITDALPLSGGTLTGNLTITKAGAYLYLNGTNSDSELRFMANGSDRWAVGMNVGDATENLNIYNYTTATTNFTILKASGNVGIGTQTPSYKLDVNGSLNSTTSYTGIMYDNDDTSYYSNPSALSRLNALNIGNQGALTGNTTYALGAYHNARYMVGLRYSSGGANYPWLVHDSWNGSAFIIHFNGVGDRFQFSEGGIGQAHADFRAPIFYDSNDTTYYIDPASTSTSANFAGQIRQNAGKYVRDFKDFQWVSGSGNYYSSGAEGWYKVAQITITSNCTGAVLYGRLYDRAYHDCEIYDISVVIRAECDFTTNNESHFVEIGCTVTASSEETNYRDKIRAILTASSTNSRTYELQFYETAWNNDSWELFTTGWTVWDSAQAPGTATGTARVNYQSKMNADTMYANESHRAPVFYDTNNTAYYLDPASTSVLNALTIGGNTALTTASTLTAGNLSGTIPSGVLGNSTHYVGTTAIALNRASASQTLTGVSIDGNAATVTNGVYTTGAQTIGGTKTFSDGVVVNGATYYTFNKPTTNAYQTVTLFGSASGGLFFTTDNAIIGTGAYYNNGWIATATSGRNIDFASGNFTFTAFSGATVGGAAAFGTVAQLSNAGVFSAIGDFRAPIFYDSNDTAYYLDPANTSLSLKTRGYITINNATAPNNLAMLNIGSSGSGETRAIDISGGWSGNENKSITFTHATGSTNIVAQINAQHNGPGSKLRWGKLYHSGDSSTYTMELISESTTSAYLTVAGSVRSPIFYDSDNTSYYINPASSSNVNNFTTAGTLYTNNIAKNATGSPITINSGSDAATGLRVYYDMQLYNTLFFTTSGWSEYGRIYGGSGTVTIQTQAATTQFIKYDGYTQEGGSFRAPIFYDSNDTSYYVDPASTSRVNTLYVANVLADSASVNGRILLYGNLHIDAYGANDIYCNYYSGRRFKTYRGAGTGNETFRADTDGIIYAFEQFRTPIIYDYNNTAYYIDAASTSVLNRLTIDGGNYAFDYFQSLSDFTSGTLVTTDIPATATEGESFVMNVVGKSYSGNTSPFNFSVQGYLYSSTIINFSGLSLDSTALSTVKIFENGGVLCFWWPTITYWNAFEVSVRAYNSAKNNYNRVTNITNSTEPTGTKKVTVTLQRFMRADVSATNSVDLRAPIFYDSNDTTYYTDPSSLSNILELKTNKNWYDSSASAWGGGINMGGNNPSIGFQSTASTWWYMLHHSSSNINFYRRSTSGSWNHDGIWDSSGNLIWQGSSVRAPIFYDQNNTAYYIDAASTSNLVGLTVANTITGAISGNAATATNVAWTGITGGARTNYDLQFQPSAGGYSGFAFKTSSAGEAGYFLIRATSDTDVYTAEGITLVADAGWLTLAQRTTASKGVRIMTGTTSSERFKITTAGDVQIVNGNTFTYNGNVVLHSGNVSTYAFAKSGSWAADLVSNYGYTRETGMQMTGGSEFVVLSKSGQGFLLVDGSYFAAEGGGFYSTNNSSGGTLLGFYSDTTTSLNFNTTAVKLNGNQILHAGNYNSYAPTLTGTGASGSWGISVTGSSASCTGNAATASNATQFGGESNTNFLRGLSSGTEANINNYTDNGFRVVAYTGHSKGLLSFTPGGSIGTVQHEYFYRIPTNGWRVRNKTDSTTWSAWGNVVMTDTNQGALTGTVITTGNSSGLSPTFTNLYANIFYDQNNTAYYIDAASGSSLNTLTMAGTITGALDSTISFAGGACTAASYNYILSGANDTGNKLVIFVNGSTRSADGGVNALTIRNDGGTFVLGTASYLTSILGSSVTINGNAALTSASTLTAGNLSGTIPSGVLGNSTHFIGTTSIALNRASASQTLTGVSIDGNSATTTLATKATRANGDFYIDDNYGNTVVGLYSATRLQGVFAMGNSYKLTADGTGVGTLYGLAWSHPNFGGVAANLADHGLLILQNGVFKGAWGGGSFRTPSDIRGTLFYDWDNTGYYCDPASTSNLNAITAAGNITAAQYYTGGWFRNNSSGNGLYNEATTQHFYSDASDMWNIASAQNTQGIRFRTGGHNGTIRGYVYANNSNDVGLLNNGGNWRLRIVGGDYALFDGSSIRAPIFYDSNDTNYYCDPNGTSSLAAVNANAYYPHGGVTESDIYARSLSINAYHHGDSLTYDTFQFNAASVYETRATVGSSFVSSTVETSIFRGDRFGGMTIANNVYQVRWTWNGTIGYRFFKTLYIANSTNGNSFTVTIESSANGSTWTTIATTGAMSNWPGHSWYNYFWNNNATIGYIRITVTPTWVNANTMDIYSMRYFCSYALDAGARLYDWDYNRNVTFPAFVDATQFRDTNNTAYYIDAASTSNLVGLTVANTITGSITGNAGGSSASCTGNAATATILQTARNINGTSFNGSAAITTATWGTARTITIGSTGKSVDGSANVSWSLAELGAAATNQTMFIGTTSVAINRTSASQTLTGISIDGSAASATTATSLNSSNSIARTGTSGNYNTDFQNTPAGTVRHQGDDSSATNNPGGTWWFIDNYRHSNSSNYWGTQVAWGWEDQANKLATRNITGGSFGSWVYYLNSSNYTSYAIARGGDTVTNTILFQSNLGTTSGSLSSPPLQAYATGTNAAFMSFHRGGSYAVNMGLDSDNVLRIGGWSASANRLQLDMSGNLTVAGAMYGTNFIDSDNTAYFCNPASTSNLVGLTVANTITGNISGTAGSISGFNNPVTSATANTIVYRDGSGNIIGNQIFGNYHNSSDDTSSSGITFIMAKFGDNYHRSASAAKVATFISGQTMNIAGSSTSCSGNAASVTDGVYLSTTQTISGVKTFSSAPIATNIAKAWVHFNGTGTIAVNASHNVASLTDNGVGDYTVNFTTAMVDANYAVAGTVTIDYTSAQSLNQLVLAVPRQTNAQVAGSCRLVCEYIHGAQLYDAVAVRAVFFR